MPSSYENKKLELEIQIFQSHFKQKHITLIKTTGPKKKIIIGNSATVKWLGFGAFTALTQVQSLVGKQRSHRLQGVAQNKTKQKTNH